ncbi:ubiquitin carboxyl-terminal hydrolase 25-like [Salvia miltiorrhiza]|uniref:ubiquitin carboxyl-terminal hydrolase 25-like n=1 Tax=Salvia miltiorrhiza TaxID=226208 RepID=UPI0025ABD57D|nr:ubiquitin carboxyl-terminal hydrolase 25-like [Salvia miltiorrhiza]XP_057812303.1 ubiquitin carboxyl-terminal hydrolase 25-like [Salvia miltiorrhiza]XP_057812304.1 ubiquitin carboxyl-terminal hydrolase 25-like [Salvia miltiorrhiza]XP_057812306.1 ubiquitin carboxyl-terminal hydrolase 25-like [Salvia miltiorrhiza]
MGMLQMTWQSSLLKSLKRKHGSPPLGLRNLGNTCYLNSVLQCLTYTPPLANFCLRYLHSSVCDFGTGKEKKGDCPFCILEKRIARSLSSEAVSDAPVKINSCLRIYAEHFRTGRQEDAHEFLRYVIDACHNTCLRIKKLQHQQRGRNGTANGGDFAGAGETVVKEIFGGALQSQVKCLSCGAESNKVDEIMDISLDILHSGSLREALQKFFQPEVLDGNNKYKCDNCKKLVAARKQMSILEAPNVLVIQLKRFEGIFGSKIDKPIAFDEILVLSSHMCKGSKDQQPEYNLFGTIVHSGFSPDSGHYYAYIKDAIGRWYCCNDSYVSVSTLQEVLSEKVYILFFSRAKQRPRTRVDAVVNGSKTHESNGNKISTMPKSGSADKSVCNKQISNHLQETNKSTNGSRSFIQKSGCVEKPFSMKISANHSETNRSNNFLATNGTKTLTCQRSDCVETPANMGDFSDNQPETCNITLLELNSCNSTDGQIVGRCVKQVDVQESSNHHSQTSESGKSKIDHERPSQQRTFSDSGSTSKVLAPGNMRIVVHKKEPGEENGHIAASPTSFKKERTGLMSDRNCMGKTSADIQSTGKGLSCLPLHNGNGPMVVDSLERCLPEVNGSAHMTDSQKSLNCQDLPNGNIGASNNSCVKRKTEDDYSCIFFAKDDQSRARVEAFKESIGKEASMILRSCGWSEEVRSFMHTTKKLCQETGNSALNDHERKCLLVSQAKRTFLSKVPESLKAKLVERLKLFSQEKQLSGI